MSAGTPPTASAAPRAPVAITGLGCVGAPGLGLAAQLAALGDGRCGLATVDAASLPLARDLPVGRVVAALPALPNRTAALAVAAGDEALRQAGLPPTARGEVAVVLGSSTAGLPESERDYLRGRPLANGKPPVFASYRRQQTHAITRQIAHALDCGGSHSSHSVACASAASALVEAVELVRSGACPLVLAIGSDALTRLTMAGFHSLHLVDPQGCRPFTAERAGMSLGEGAAALLIEDAAHARRRGATPLASVVGWGLRADGYHGTSPDPRGTQLERAIREALADAGLAGDGIDYVSAHGTGTADNDQCEAATLTRVFGAVPTASCKRSYGHSMGASAAIEAVACCLALREQRLFASAGVELGAPLPGPEFVRAGRPARVRAVCSTTLAFGGVNAALVFAGGERCA